LAAFAAILLFGAAVRLAHLGRAEFLEDELDHFYAAQSLEASRPPLLPGGREYRRGLEYTRLVQQALRPGWDREFSARLPSTVFGILALILFAAIVWRWAGPWAAVWAAALLAIFPEAVRQSRYTRFYSLQLCLGLAAMFALWQVVRSAGAREVAREQFLRQFAWLALAAALLLFAARLQMTALSVGVGMGVILLVAAVADVRARGGRAWRNSVPLVGCGIGAVGVVAYFGARPEALGALSSMAGYAPRWALGSGPFHYYHMLREWLPLVVAFAPLSLLAAARVDARLTIFLVIWYAVPLALHSFAFTWKAERFVLLATPALFAITAIAAAKGSTTLRAWLLGMLCTEGRSSRRCALEASTLVTVVATSVLVAQPAFDRARFAPSDILLPQRTEWSRVERLLMSDSTAHTVPLGATDALPALYYLGRLDFTVEPAVAEQVSILPDSVRPRSPGATVIDAYAGVPLLLTVRGIREAFPNADRALIAIDGERIGSGIIPADLLDSLRLYGRELCAGKCGEMLLYSLPLREPLVTLPDA
jgi:hypothetical protein